MRVRFLAAVRGVGADEHPQRLGGRERGEQLHAAVHHLRGRAGVTGTPAGVGDHRGDAVGLTHGGAALARDEARRVDHGGVQRRATVVHELPLDAGRAVGDDDLHAEIEVPLATAMLGGEAKVQTLKGLTRLAETFGSALIAEGMKLLGVEDLSRETLG